ARALVLAGDDGIPDQDALARLEFDLERHETSGDAEVGMMLSPWLTNRQPADGPGFKGKIASLKVSCGCGAALRRPPGKETAGPKPRRPGPILRDARDQKRRSTPWFAWLASERAVVESC